MHKFIKLKKILLSFFVVVAFALYAVYQRLGNGNNPVLNLDQDLSVTPTSTQAQPGGYKDGEYAGKSAFTIFGNVQVAAVISGGRITDIKFLQFPNGRSTSINISNTSLPRLKTEAISAQSAKVDIVSGATQTSEGFAKSLASALANAKL